jgi:hypothetical protein
LVLTKDAFRPYVVGMDTDLTVSTLADHIGAHMLGGRVYPEIRDQVTRRLRYWTQSGVMRPAGGVLTGTGTHRRYGVESVLVGAVLVELARTLGLGLATLKTVADRLYDDVFRGEKADPGHWRGAAGGSRRHYLQMTFDQPSAGGAPMLVTAMVVAPEYFSAPETRPMCAVLIDLERIVRQIRD